MEVEIFYHDNKRYFSRPTVESDPNCNEKKKFIGNDNATIVYNESGEEYNLNTIKVS